MTRWGCLADARRSNWWSRHFIEENSRVEDLVIHIDPREVPCDLRFLTARLHSSRRLESYHCRWIRSNVNGRLRHWNPCFDIIQFCGCYFVIIKLEVTHTGVYIRLFATVVLS